MCSSKRNITFAMFSWILNQSYCFIALLAYSMLLEVKDRLPLTRSHLPFLPHVQRMCVCTDPPCLCVCRELLDERAVSAARPSSSLHSMANTRKANRPNSVRMPERTARGGLVSRRTKLPHLEQKVDFLLFQYLKSYMFMPNNILVIALTFKSPWPEF